MVKVTGKVESKTLSNSGHSTLLLVVEMDANAAGDAQGKLPTANITISSPSADLIDSFKVGQSVSFTL